MKNDPPRKRAAPLDLSGRVQPAGVRVGEVSKHVGLKGTRRRRRIAGCGVRDSDCRVPAVERLAGGPGIEVVSQRQLAELLFHRAADERLDGEALLEQPKNDRVGRTA
jgi:hypothetical protein